MIFDLSWDHTDSGFTVRTPGTSHTLCGPAAAEAEASYAISDEGIIDFKD